jgi:transcriptional regulator of arginine metabolism
MIDDRLLDEYILHIVQNSEIKEQKDLQDILKKRQYNIPQATLSRRLKKLKIVKISGVYKTLSSQNNLPLILNLQISEFGMIVMHTHPGHANSLAYFIDKKYVHYSYNNIDSIGILGTIAGDDTVLLILKNKTALKNVLMEIYDFFTYLKAEVPTSIND